MSRRKESNADYEMNDLKPCESQFVNELKEKAREMMNVEVWDKVIVRDVERVVILRFSTKHVNLWIRQLEMKRDKRAGWVDWI